jgi:triosephosphate isomerase
MKYIVGNWKMNMNMEAVMNWVTEFDSLKGTEVTEKEVIIAPSSLHLPVIDGLNKGKTYKLAAQDVSISEKGAHTGDLGVFQIKDFCQYCIVGHSERQEPRELVIAKRDACLKEGITPIVCFVEPSDASNSYTKGAIVAWEDPHNISVNGEYRAKDPKEVMAGIEIIAQQLPDEAPLIYGGSVNRQNIESLAKINRLNGVLPGNASLDPQHFLDIILNG